MAKTNEAQLLIDLRQSAGLTQRQAAEGLGVDPQTISRWERGESRVKQGEFERARAWYRSVIKAGQLARAWLEKNPVAGADDLYSIAPPDLLENSNRFQREAARRNATDEELDLIQQILTNPVAIRILAIGSGDKLLSPEERSAEFEMLTAALTHWLDARKARRTASRTAPIATGFQRMSSKQLEADAKKPKTKRA